MGEWIRIWKNRRFVAFVLLLTALHAFLFLRAQWVIPQENQIGASILEFAGDYRACVDKYKNLPPEQALADVKQEYEERRAKQSDWDVRDYNLLQLEEKLSYLLDYPLFLERVEENYEAYSKVSIFTEDNGFARRNLEKTRDDFSGLAGLTLPLEDDLGLMAFFSFTFSDYVAAIFLFALCFQLLQERRRGLAAVIHSARGGRGRLAARRIGVLFAGAVFVTALTYGVNLLQARLIYGRIAYSAPVQTLAPFQKLAQSCSVGEWLVYVLAGRVLTLFLFALFVYFLLSLVREMTAGFFLGALLMAGEYLCYTLIGTQSAAVCLRYVNLFVLLHFPSECGAYLNINLFGHAASVWMLFWFACGALFAVFGTWTVWMGEKRYPFAQEGRLTRLFRHMVERLLQLRNLLPMTGFELYKHLFFEGGIVVLLLLAVVAHAMTDGPGMGFYSVWESYQNTYYDDFAKQAAGASGDAYIQQLRQFISGLREEIESEQAAYDQCYQDFMDGKLSYAEYFNQTSNAGMLQAKQEAFSVFSQRAEDLAAYQEASGLACRMVNPFGYERLFGEPSHAVGRRNACLELLFAILLLCPLLVYERQGGTRMLVRATRHGRTAFFLQKAAWAALCSGVIVAAFTGVQVGNAVKVYGLPELNAPSGSVECLRHLNWNVSLGTMVMLLFVLRWLLLFSASGFILFLSGITAKLDSCLLACVLLLLIPSALYLAGVEVCRYLSLTVPLGVTELLECGSSGWSAWRVLPLVLVAVLGMACLYAAGLSWRRTQSAA